MKKTISSIFIGLFIIAIILLGMKIYFSPDKVNERGIKKAAESLEKVEEPSDDTGSTIYTFEEAKEKYTVNDALRLVNSGCTLDKDFVPELVDYKETGVMMNECITDAYAALSASVMEKCDDKLFVMSSYRSYEDQERVYEEEGAEVAALPGTSEHQTGLALDVYVFEHAGAGFIETEAGKYVNSNCQDFGFIIRYPYGQEEKTGFDYEPWHIRYVGLPHSKIIADNNMVFDDYAALYEVGRYYERDGYLIARMPMDKIEIPNRYDDVTISEDGLGNVFVTIKTTAQ